MTDLIQVTGKEFENKTLVLDGHNYTDCKFKNCKIEYSGGEMNLSDCELDKTTFHLKGNAAYGANFLKCFYQNNGDAGKKMVLDLLNDQEGSINDQQS